MDKIKGLMYVFRIAFGITMLGLFLAGSATAASQVSKLEVRGAAATGTGTQLWDAQSFAGFSYDLKYDRSTESLNLFTLNGRTIEKGNLWYNTTKVLLPFKVYEKENVTVNSKSYYSLVGWQVEKWIAINDKANKIAKLTFEMSKEEKKTLFPGETWFLGAGYELTVNDINARTNPQQVWFTLKKDGAIVDEGIGQAPTDGSDAGQQKAVFYKTKTILDESDSLLFTVYVDNIFDGATSDMVQFKYAWLIDETSAKKIKSDDVYGVFKVRTTGENNINLSNENTVSLSRNTETTIMDNIKFRTADNDTLRFYPYVEYAIPGTYELRGRVANGASNPRGDILWNAQSFAAFFYDLKYDRSTESLNLVPTLENVTRTIDIGNLWYNTTLTRVDFKAYEKENVTVNSKSNYPLVGWQAQKWIAINNTANKISKLIFEMGKEEKKTLTTGDTWSLGSGYELTIDTIEARADPRKVWFTLRKDGEIVDNGVGQAPNGTSQSDKQKAVYNKTRTILGEPETLLYTLYVDTIFPGATSDMVQFKYAWLIDESSAIEIKAADKFGVFEVRTADSNSVNLSNFNALSLSQNTETTLMDEMKFKVADSDTLRFYPKVDYVIDGTQFPPYSLSILINHGEAYARSRNVTLNLSAIGAVDMSFSNDGYSWSTPEPYATSKSWTLAEGEGLKTVNFRAMNSYGSSGFTDTIVLKILPSTKLVEIRGTPVNEPQTPDLMPAWDARNFAGLLYEFKYDGSTERLTIAQELRTLNGSRAIAKDMLRYETGKIPVDFNVFRKEGVLVAGMSSYDVVGWQGEKYVAIKGKANNLSKLVMEMGVEDKKTVAIGETWQLGSGYELKVNSIDISFPMQVWFTLLKNGSIIDEGIGHAPAGDTISDKQKAVYYKTMTIQGESEALLFTVYVDKIFSGQTSDIVQFKYGWLIDKDSTKEIKTGDIFDVFQVRSANQDRINMTNEIQVNLSRNTVSTILGNIKFKVADSDQLRFYPFMTYTTPGTYEVRGTVANDPLLSPSWGASSFAGLYYDLKSNIKTETLSLTKPATYRTIERESLWYNTTKVPVDFKVFEKEGVLVNGARSYDVTGWQGEKYVAINGKANKLAKHVLEMGKDENKTLTTGETWSLGAGYELTINAIDARTRPKQVWFTLRKNGAIIDEGIGQSPNDNSTIEKQKAVYIKTMTIKGESNALLFSVYIDDIFSGPTSDNVRFKYAWLVDSDSAKEIRGGEIYDLLMVRIVNPQYINLSNENSISLAKNTETLIFGNISLKAADNNTMRFYPKVDYVIVDEEIPTIINVISPNGGENWSRGTTHVIRWNYSGNPGANVKIELLKGGVASIINSSTPNDGSDNWSIPLSQTLGIDYRVRITSTSNPAYNDTSNNNFRISSSTPTINVISPNGGENWKRGTTHVIRWNYSGNPGANVKIELLKGGVASIINSSTPNDGSHNWSIPLAQTPGINYRVRITSTSNPAYKDTSNSNFSIRI